MTVLADAIAADVLGAQIPPLSQQIDARWLMAYAASLDETDPRYYDTVSAGGPWAHPLFAVCYEWPAALALRALVVAAALQPRSVHATHHVIVHRPPRAGDTLHTAGRVIAVEPRRAGTRVVSRFVTTDASGGLVTTTDYGSVYRDVPVAGGAAAATGGAPPARPAITSPGWIESIDVPANAAWIYTECARIYNPIHTDLAVARGAGLAAPILHGTATLALAISRALCHARPADPRRVVEIAARFTGMVPMPSTLVVRGAVHSPEEIGFDVADAGGATVLAGGLIRLSEA
ncbi:MAG TPA: MaoC/PaaZ C-terminal domain-containing protein [Methylomirabilota bacterium]|nr:MaoC/PaaZ C-terminal domain-containing protein [Methylomirabilota bacterium]